jgi:hypothetical protein
MKLPLRNFVTNMGEQCIGMANSDNSTNNSKLLSTELDLLEE